MKSDYEERKQQRIERFRKLADKNETEAGDRFGAARKTIEHIPFGQPILVGHHSEKRHRAALDRHDQNMRKGCEAVDKAKHYQHRADAAESSRAISSDDPDAVSKLKAKIADAKANQEHMKAVNAAWRKAGKPKAKRDDVDHEAWKTAFEKFPEQRELLQTAYNTMAHDFLTRAPFTYGLTNNSGNIKRMEQRLTHLASLESAPYREYEVSGVRIVEDPDENRLQLFFNGKPDAEVRKRCKTAGFRWAPSVGAWQRHLSNAARFAAAHALDVHWETIAQAQTDA